MLEISVIIPLLNKGSYIKRAIDSILTQEYQNFEIIVVDGHSTDQGPDIVMSIHDSRLKLIAQPTKGVSEARNFGVEMSHGSLIAFLDADDEWLPNHLNTIIRLVQKFPQAGAYTTAYKICNENGKLRWPKYRAIPSPPWEGVIPNYFLSAARGEYPVWTSAVCIPKKIFIEMCGFPIGIWWGEDADLWGKIALRYPIAFSWEPGAIYHWDTQNRACCKPSLEQEPFVKTARKIMDKDVISGDFFPYLDEYVNKKEIYRAACLIFCGFPEKAKSVLKNCKTKDFIVRKTLLRVLSNLPSPVSHLLLKKVLNLSEQR
ncbi:MAG: glycosyltransferase family 2 protein [Methanoregula sp.]|nr:glycosyltransferase family 2 protein [Methanoregula sp.]